MKNFLFVLGCALLWCGQSLAQNSTMFAIYHDIVKPSKDAQYREAVKKLKAACEQNKMDFSWTTYAFDDNSYSHVVPMKNFADLDRKPFAPLEEKLGKEALGALRSAIDQCVESQSSSVITSLSNLSYLTPSAEDTFREIIFWQVETGRQAEAEKILLEWKQLGEAKKIPEGFQAYRVAFGGEPGYYVLHWGKNIPDWADKRQKSNALMADEGDKLWAKTLLVTRKYDTHNAWRQADLSYPRPATAATK